MASTVDASRISERQEDDKSLALKLKTLARWVRESKYTVFFTGAGVSTSAGVGDYRGPTGAWTMSRIRELKRMKARGSISKADMTELQKLLVEAEKKGKQAAVPMIDAQPTPTHMAMATLIRKKLAHYVVTTNLDGIHRKSGLSAHSQISNLHGCVYAERCTACGYDFERNYHTRRDVHVHDHHIGTCERCGSKPPASYTGRSTSRDTGSGTSYADNHLVGTCDENVGTKDTHINFGENLDDIDWNEAHTHCKKAGLVIVAGTSMSLRHITHFPFMAKRTVIINLQQTPDDQRCHLRLWGKTDPIFEALMEELKVQISHPPAWRPRDALALEKIPKHVHPYYHRAAKRLSDMASRREREAELRRTCAAKREQAEAKAREAKAEALVAARAEARASEKLRRSICRALKAGLEIGNLHEDVKTGGGGHNCHKWSMFVRSSDPEALPLEPLVESVTYHLHPTFSPAKVTVTKGDGFLLPRLGWGAFSIRVVVDWKKEAKMPSTSFVHQLNFSKPETSQLVKMEMVEDGGSSPESSVSSGSRPLVGCFG